MPCPPVVACRLLRVSRMRAWILVAALGAACTEVHGKLESEGGPLGVFVFAPNDCASGADREFYGVSLTEDDYAVTVRLVDDVLKGKVVVVEAPGFDDPGIELTARDCRTFSMDLDYDQCNGYQGHVELDCDVTAPGVAVPAMPGTIRGKVTFERCN